MADTNFQLGGAFQPERAVDFENNVHFQQSPTLTGRGTVTQASSISTGVTVNAIAGAITTVSTTLAAAADATFTVTNSAVEANDVVIAHLASTDSAGTPQVVVSAVADGSFDILITNIHASAALDDTLTINFAIIKTAA